jgi:hypothetical protein
MLDLLNTIQALADRFLAHNGWDPMYFVAALAVIFAIKLVINPRKDW